jgi:hypothetical protein
MISLSKFFASGGEIREWKTGLKAHTDRTRIGYATRIFNFQWHLTLIFFYVFQIFGTTLRNFSYLVSISCEIFIRWRFYLFLKTENSRRVVEPRSVCMDLYSSWNTSSYFSSNLLTLTEVFLFSFNWNKFFQ